MHRLWIRVPLRLATIIFLFGIRPVAHTAESEISIQRGLFLLSRSPAGDAANDATVANGISPDARYVVLTSAAYNLVTDDNNRVNDVFVLDRVSGIVTRESLDEEGFEASEPSILPSMSGNGRFVVFQTAAALASSDVNGLVDIYHRDRARDTIRRVSVGLGGEEPDGESTGPSLSLDGRVLAFTSTASNLVVADANQQSDVFVVDRGSQKIVRVSVGFDGTEANGASFQPHLSADGRFVTFSSNATNLVDGDTNGVADVFVHEIATGVTVRASIAGNGDEANGQSYTPRISADGSRVTFASQATNLSSRPMPPAQIYVHDVRRQRTRAISVNDEGEPSNGTNFVPRISGDGRFVAFTSNADNLVEGVDPNLVMQIFVHDILEQRTVLASRGTDGAPANGAAFLADFSAQGQFLTFASWATNLVSDETNDETQTYLWLNRVLNDDF